MKNTITGGLLLLFVLAVGGGSLYITIGGAINTQYRKGYCDARGGEVTENLCIKDNKVIHTFEEWPHF